MIFSFIIELQQHFSESGTKCEPSLDISYYCHMDCYIYLRHTVSIIAPSLAFGLRKTVEAVQ